MKRSPQHCRVITRVPLCAELPQSSFAAKLDAVTQMIDTALLAQRQSAWKMFYPPDNDIDDTDGGTTPTIPF